MQAGEQLGKMRWKEKCREEKLQEGIKWAEKGRRLRAEEGKKV